RDGTRREHRRRDLLTKLAGAPYEPDAPCVRWERFLAEILPDAEIRAFVQRALGSALVGAVFGQVLFFLHGSGANGKATLLRAVRETFGDYGIQTAPELLLLDERGSRHPTEQADLFGVRFACTIEVEEGKRLAETLVKQMSGGDPMRARHLYQDFFEW